MTSAQRAAEAVRAFRVADRQIGGAHLYTAVQQYAASFGPQLAAAAADDAVFCAAAGMAELSGWMAHDAGWDERAAQHFRRAHQFAQVGGDRSLAAQAMASRAHLALYCGSVTDAQEFAETSSQLIEGGENQSVRARVLAMQARVAARSGDGPRFRAFLRQAEHLVGSRPTRVSAWTSPFDEGSLAIEASRGLCDLGDLAASMVHAQRVLELRSADRLRARALARLGLVNVLVRQGEIDHAWTQIHAVSTVISAISSRVVAQQYATAVGQLRRLSAHAEVEQLSPVVEGTVMHTGLPLILGVQE